ncbi:MAG TPA: hypothetical protein PLH38_04655 [Clostridia bacterium]|nr:hypothetical protein [Clostridia bacterium]
MARYSPQSLPMSGTRSTADQHEQKDSAPKLENAMEDSAEPSIMLAQQIRREHGMQGVRGFVAAMREYLPASHYRELCSAMGVSENLRPKQPERVYEQAQPVNAQNENPPHAQQNMGNQLQMLQMLTQLMNMQQSPGQNAFGQGNSSGMNPLMLAQLLSSMQGNR